MKKTLAIDFDGVIHAYSRGWENGAVYDEPVPGALDAIALLAGRYRLEVFTARDDLTPVVEWLIAHSFYPHISAVTNQKPKAWAYIDDRGIRFESWEQALDLVQHLDASDGWHPILEDKPLGDSDGHRRCPGCGVDITDQLDASYEHGYRQGYEKRAEHVPDWEQREGFGGVA